LQTFGKAGERSSKWTIPLGMTGQDVIDSLGITAPEIAALIVDGVDGKVDAMLTVPIKEDGYMAIFPPVAGG